MKLQLGMVRTTTGAVLAGLVLATGARAGDSFQDWLRKDQSERQQYTSGVATNTVAAEQPKDKPATEQPKDKPAIEQPKDKPAIEQPKAGTPARAQMPQRTDTPLPDRDWLIMVYAAGDNNLDPFSVSDVAEMEKIGSSDKLAIVVLMDRVDTGEWSSTRRFLVRKPSDQGGKHSWDPALPTCKDLGELNMGAPETLRDFATWSLATYPAKQTALVLWNHGGGWRDAVSRAVQGGSAARSLAPPPKPAVSRLARGIAWDDTDGGDFLEMREVRGALETLPKLSLIGCDACLMGMVEVAYELRDRCDYFVASEELEPGDGWPYDRILPFVARGNNYAAEAFCADIVREFAASYKDRDRVTLSAVRQAAIPALAGKIDALACALIDHIESGKEPPVSFDDVPGYPSRDPEFRDLGGFLKVIDAGDYPPTVKAAGKAVTQALTQALVANFSHEALHGQGLAIYPGGGNDDADYRAAIIQFARDTRWDEMIREVTYRKKTAARENLATASVNRWAILIGIEDYQDPNITKLRYSVDDVERLHQVLVKHAGYREENIIVLTNAAATVEKVRSTLGTDLPRQVNDQDMVLIYFSGHGGAEPSLRGEAKDGTEKYMMLVDSKIENMYGTALPMSELARILGRIQADKAVVVMDSCYSGAAGGRGVLRDGMKAGGLTDDYLGALTSSSGTVVLTASQASEVSMESVALGLGLFTHFTCLGLEGQADDNKDGLVSVLELFQYVSNMVPPAAKKMGSSQHPVMKGEITGTFPIALCGKQVQGNK